MLYVAKKVSVKVFLIDMGLSPINSTIKVLK